MREFDALATLTEMEGVFQDRGCWFVSTVTNPQGLHTTLLSGYVNCEVVFPHHRIMWNFAEQLVAPFKREVQAFVFASTGDIALGMYTSAWAGVHGLYTTAVWADRQPDNSYAIVRNGFASAIAGRQALVVNDRISQGGTTRKVVAQVREHGGEVIGVAALSTPSTLTAESLGVPRLHSLCHVDVEVSDSVGDFERVRELPVAVDEAVGHGADFRDENPDWPGGFVSVLTTPGLLVPV